MLAVSGSAQWVFVGSNQIEALEEKLYLARRRYTDQEQGKRNKQGEKNKTLILAACALGHVENTKERCRKRREIYLGTQLENCRCSHTHTHTQTHTFYHSWQIPGTTHQKGVIKVCCVQSSKQLWPSHQLAATHCARRAECRAHRRAACKIKQKLGHHFSISKWLEGSKSVLCPVIVQLCPSYQLAASHCVRAAGRAACEIKYKFSHHFATTQIPLESGSSADERFRTDLKIFNKNCIIYVSQADVRSEQRWVQ